MSTITVLHLVTERDGREIVALLEQLYGPLSNRPDTGDIQEHANRNELVVARSEESAILGMATLVCVRRFALIAAHAEDFVVHSGFRRQKIGTALMRKLAALARERGAKFLDLETDPWRTEARAFYDALQYTQRDKQVLRLDL